MDSFERWKLASIEEFKKELDLILNNNDDIEEQRKLQKYKEIQQLFKDIKDKISFSSEIEIELNNLYTEMKKIERELDSILYKYCLNELMQMQEEKIFLNCFDSFTIISIFSKNFCSIFSMDDEINNIEKFLFDYYFYLKKEHYSFYEYKDERDNFELCKEKIKKKGFLEKKVISREKIDELKINKIQFSVHNSYKICLEYYLIFLEKIILSFQEKYDINNFQKIFFPSFEPFISRVFLIENDNDIYYEIFLYEIFFNDSLKTKEEEEILLEQNDKKIIYFSLISLFTLILFSIFLFFYKYLKDKINYKKLKS